MRGPGLELLIRVGFVVGVGCGGLGGVVGCMEVGWLGGRMGLVGSGEDN